MTPLDGDLEPDAAFDPLTDILFAAIAVLFVALIAVAPAFDGLRAEAAAPAADTPPPVVLFRGAPLDLIIATAAGIRHGDGAATLVPLDRVADDAGLRARLAGFGERRPALLIEPGGEEAAFVLDPLLATAHVGVVRQLRLTVPCSDGRGGVDLRRCLTGVGEGVAR